MWWLDAKGEEKEKKEGFLAALGMTGRPADRGRVLLEDSTHDRVG
jgi:hypothetical protein